MEIPSSQGGVVKEVKAKLGDMVKQGSVVLKLEAAGAAASVLVEAPKQAPTHAAHAQSAPEKVATASTTPTPAPALTAASFSGAADPDCDVLVLGAGAGGYSAAFRAADLGLKVVLVERYAALGGVCLNVGCIPSKALLHAAAVMDEVIHMAALGIDFGAPGVDIEKLGGHKDKVVGKLTGGLAAMAKMRKGRHHAGDMLGEVALAIEMRADAVDIGKTNHPHPTLGESIGMAAEVAHGSCTNLPARK